MRILLDLMLSDHAPLINAAVRQLLRHFNQRQEIVQAFNQVRFFDLSPNSRPQSRVLCFLIVAMTAPCQIQLLVSSEDIENYRDIKEAMDALRLVVESKLDRVVQLRRCDRALLAYPPFIRAPGSPGVVAPRLHTAYAARCPHSSHGFARRRSAPATPALQDPLGRGTGQEHTPTLPLLLKR